MGMLIDMMKNKINDNITIPQEVKETTNEYMNENNFVQKFLDEYIEITNNKDDRIKKTELYSLYKTNTDDPLTKSKFYYNMTQNGFLDKTYNGYKTYSGLKINEDFDLS